MNLWKRIKMYLFGYVYIGDRIENGWKGPLPFYQFRCPIHGLVEDYLHRHEQELSCPLCNRRKEVKE